MEKENIGIREELPEKIKGMTYQQGLKLYKRKKQSLVADIILIILILALGLYIVFNVEAMKAANDPCGFCQDKTGRICAAPSEVSFNWGLESETNSETISVPNS